MVTIIECVLKRPQNSPRIGYGCLKFPKFLEGVPQPPPPPSPPPNQFGVEVVLLTSQLGHRN